MTKSARGAARIVPSSGNVFADLGQSDAVEIDAKARLAFAINALLADRGLTGARAASVLGIRQSELSALGRLKIEELEVWRLMGFAIALGCDIEIQISPPRRRGLKPGRVRIVAATRVG
jgi:predicted XRE-type DNA-binding protein